MSATDSVPTSGSEAGPSEPVVRAHRLGDGLVVRLSGVLDGQAVPALRRELLAELPADYADVLVDAGSVTSLDDDVLAVLVAGSSWARSAGCRFALAAVSPSVAEQIDILDLESALPVLGSAG